MATELCDVSVPRHAPTEFAGKIVFIGASAAGSYEVRPTAVSETSPGFFILTTALDNLLHNDAMRRVPLELTIAITPVRAAAPAFLVVPSRSIPRPLRRALGILALYAAIAFCAYRP